MWIFGRWWSCWDWLGSTWLCIFIIIFITLDAMPIKMLSAWFKLMPYTLIPHPISINSINSIHINPNIISIFFYIIITIIINIILILLSPSLLHILFLMWILSWLCYISFCCAFATMRVISIVSMLHIIIVMLTLFTMIFMMLVMMMIMIMTMMIMLVLSSIIIIIFLILIVFTVTSFHFTIVYIELAILTVCPWPIVIYKLTRVWSLHTQIRQSII